MQKFDGLLLDFDGTLVNSLDSLFNIYMNFLSSYNISGTHEEFNHFNGFKLTTIIKSLQATYNIPGSIDNLISHYYSKIENIYIDTPPMDGAEELIKYAYSNNILIGIVSSANRSCISRWVNRYFPNYVSIIVGGDDVSKGKPNPMPYLTAASKLSLEPINCLCVEDSVIGIQSAINSGSNVILLDKNDSILINYSYVKKVKNLKEIIKLL